MLLRIIKLVGLSIWCVVMVGVLGAVTVVAWAAIMTAHNTLEIIAWVLDPEHDIQWYDESLLEYIKRIKDACDK